MCNGQTNELFYKSITVECIRTKKEYEHDQSRKLPRALVKQYHAHRAMENEQNWKNSD